MRNILAATAITVLCSACSMPPPEMDALGDIKTFLVRAPPGAVYKAILEGARTCYAQRDIASHFYSDNRTGMVSMSVKNGLGSHALFNAEMAPAKGGTRVDVFFVKGPPIFADAIEQWTQGIQSACPAATLR